jgi:hypothetical protein
MFQGRVSALTGDATPAKMNNKATALSERRLKILSPHQIQDRLSGAIITLVSTKKKRYFAERIGMIENQRAGL